MTPLDKGQLWVMRLQGLLAAAVLLAAGAVGETVLGDRLGLPRGSIVLPLLVPILYLALLAPGRRFRAWGYGIDAGELQVRHGVWTQVHSVVPLDRIQHIDISQGPIERAFRVCRLIVHTAGTLHSQVTLPGLSREVAEAMRDSIRARIREQEA